MIQTINIGTQPENFVWATGIEDTFIPQSRPGYRPLDEYELVGHYRHWREDLALAREIGAQAIRWGVPWYRVEPERGRFDWRWTDEVIPYLVEELGITPIIDLMHYGCPLWLDGEFNNPQYPQAVASYAAAFARRYQRLIIYYTPLNEPKVNALMCGKRGVWPPYLRGDRGYVRLMLQLIRGIFETVAALKAVSPNAVMVQVEAAGLSEAGLPELEELVGQRRERGYLSYDLLTGKITPEHPSYSWLIRCGATPAELADIAGRAIPLEVMGLNFYPQWSTQQVLFNRLGRRYSRPTDKEGRGFATLLKEYYQRYQVPVMVTETSASGSTRLRATWLESSVAAIKELRGEGVPVIGYTWFPLFTMINWRYRTGQMPVEQYRQELGLYTLAENSGGSRWKATLLVEQFRHYAQNSQQAIGSLLMAK